MTSRSETPRSPAAHPAARALAALGVLVWLIGLMGIVDITVPLVPLVDFYEAYLIETSWGLLYTVLLGVPTAALVARPRHEAAAQQVLMCAAALALAAVVAPEPGHLVPAALAVGLVAGVRRLAGVRALPPLPRRTLTRRDLPGAVVVLAGLAGAVVVASHAIAAFRDPAAPTDTTQNLDHWPVHGAFAVATVLVALLVVLRTRGVWLPAVSATVAAAWFGVTSVMFPEHYGSLGVVGGTLAIAWGLAVAGLAVARRVGEAGRDHDAVVDVAAT